MDGSLGKLGDNIKGLLSRIKEYWLSLSAAKRVGLIVWPLLAVAVVIAIVLIINNTGFSVIFRGVEDRDAGEILNYLDENQIKYKYDRQTGTISVKSSVADRTAMDLSIMGYPRSGLAYDPLTSGGLFETESEKRERSITNLQNRLQATIRTLEAVDDAYVTLSVPQKSYFVLAKDKGPSKATVTVHLKPGMELSNDQVQGIERLITTSVEGLSVENVTIIDSSGAILNTMTTNAGFYLSTLRDKMEAEKAEEKRKKIVGLLEPVFGPNKVLAEVNVEIDFNKSIAEAITYTPVIGDSGVISTEDGVSERISGTDGTGGRVGAETNAELPNYLQQEGALDNGQYSRDEFSREYLVNQLKEQIQKEGGEIKSVGVSVLIDANNLSEAARQEYTALIARSVGANVEDVLILATPFIQPETVEPPAPEVPIWWIFTLDQLIMIGSVLALLLLIIILFIVISISRRRKNKKSETAAVVEDYDKAAAKKALEAILPGEIIPNETKEMALKKQIRAFTDQNPQIVAQLVRTWIREEGGTS